MAIHRRKKQNLFKRAWFWYWNSFNAKLFTVLSITSIALIVIFINNPNKSAQLNYITAVVIAFSGVGSAIYLGRGLVEKNRHDKIKNSFSFTEFFDDPKLNELKDKVKENYQKDKIAPEKLVKEVKANKELLHQLKRVLNKIEDMSIAVQFNVVDEEVLYRSLDHLVRYYCNNFESYIDEIRRDHDDETIFYELCLLANSWEDDIYLSNGKEIDIWEKY